MAAIIDFSKCRWKLAGWIPNLWELGNAIETGEKQNAEILPVKADVPGSVQGALLAAGIIPDWTKGFNARYCEWVENRHWVYTTEFSCDFIPSHCYDLVLPGVDSTGWVRFDGKIIGKFNGAHRPHRFTLEPANGSNHRLDIIFDLAPRFAGQFGRTPEMPLTKPRFYYTWDWIPRIVQIGITQAPYIEDQTGPQLRISEMWSSADSPKSAGILCLKGNMSGSDRLSVTLQDHGRIIFHQSASAGEFAAGLLYRDFNIKLWYPNGAGEAKLYDLLIDAGGAGTIRRCVGFKEITWAKCSHSPPESDPWICTVNGKPLFLQGFNWTPIRANYADLKFGDYQSRLQTYRELGSNILRVWGGASIEPECFYDICDEYGLLLWQEFPLCSSGLSSTPPSDASSIAEMDKISDYYFERISPHVSLLAWSGGNELQRNEDGSSEGGGIPCTVAEPILAMLSDKAKQRDPHRRFMATSASGPFEFGINELYGTGKLWDVHGPWKCAGKLDELWFDHWDKDDSLFRSEFGCPGASDAELIRHYADGATVFPCSIDTPWWRYPVPWWIEEDQFRAEKGRDPIDLEEYVAWSQLRQSTALEYALRKMKERFPRCGGAIIWMGHDSFPCAANTSVIDFEGKLKPAGDVIRRIFKSE